MDKLLLFLIFMALECDVSSLRCNKIHDSDLPGQVNTSEQVNCSKNDACQAIDLKINLEAFGSYYMKKIDCLNGAVCGRLCAAAQQVFGATLKQAIIESCEESCCRTDFCNPATSSGGEKNKTASALKCYQSFDTNVPNQRNKPKRIVTCKQGEECIFLYADVVMNSKTYYKRSNSCAPKASCGSTCAKVKSKLALGVKMDKCKESCCSKSLCNGVSSSRVNTGSFVLMLIMLAMTGLQTEV